MVTSHELARKLLEKDDVIILTNGYEMGLCEIKEIREIEIHTEPLYEIGTYYGPYDEAYDPKLSKVKAILLPRNNGTNNSWSE